MCVVVNKGYTVNFSKLFKTPYCTQKSRKTFSKGIGAAAVFKSRSAGSNRIDNVMVAGNVNCNGRNFFSVAVKVKFGMEIRNFPYIFGSVPVAFASSEGYKPC